jgi:hypothetical protein
MTRAQQVSLFTDAELRKNQSQNLVSGGHSDNLLKGDKGCPNGD